MQVFRERMVDTMKTYRVVIEPIEDGWWMASVPSVQGCRTQGRTIKRATRRIREALSLFVNDAEKAGLEVELKLPGDFKRAIEKYKAEARAARDAQTRTAELAKRLASRAVRELHLTMREAGKLLGVSHQRIEQIARSRAS